MRKFSANCRFLLQLFLLNCSKALKNQDYDKFISYNLGILIRNSRKIKLLGKFEHSRHRSVTNAFVYMVAALINYQMSDNKPSITSLLIC